MEDILYVKAEQNDGSQKEGSADQRCGDIVQQQYRYGAETGKGAVLYAPGDSKILTMFTVTKIYEAVHKVYPKIQIENLGETDFIVEYEPQKKEKKWMECLKTIVVAAIVLIGSAFTIMTFNEDVNVAGVFDRIYHMVTGEVKAGGTILEMSYAVGLPIGILVFYNHFKKQGY